MGNTVINTPELLNLDSTTGATILAKGTVNGIELYFDNIAAELITIAENPGVQRLEEAPSRLEVETRGKEFGVRKLKGFI